MPTAMPSASTRKPSCSMRLRIAAARLLRRVILGDVERHFGDPSDVASFGTVNPDHWSVVMSGFWPAMSCLSSVRPQVGVVAAEELALGKVDGIVERRRQRQAFRHLHQRIPRLLHAREVDAVVRPTGPAAALGRTAAPEIIDRRIAAAVAHGPGKLFHFHQLVDEGVFKLHQPVQLNRRAVDEVDQTAHFVADGLGESSGPLALRARRRGERLRVQYESTC